MEIADFTTDICQYDYIIYNFIQLNLRFEPLKKTSMYRSKQFIYLDDGKLNKIYCEEQGKRVNNSTAVVSVSQNPDYTSCLGITQGGDTYQWI